MSSKDTARIPEAQALFSVSELTVTAMPPACAAWRDGTCP